PTNHFASLPSPSSTFVHGANHSSSAAASAQNSSGCSTLCRYIDSYCSRLFTWAFAANSAGGGNTRFSRRLESRFLPSSNVVTTALHRFIYPPKGTLCTKSAATRVPNSVVIFSKQLIASCLHRSPKTHVISTGAAQLHRAAEWRDPLHFTFAATTACSSLQNR